MNMHKIELPPLPPLHIVPSVEPVDYPEVAQVLLDYARAAIELYQRRIEELESQLEAIGAGGVSSQRITSPSRGEPVAYRLMRNNGNGVWLSDGRGWCEGRPEPSLVRGVEGDPQQWRIEYAYAAPQPAEPEKEPPCET